jgi:DNA-binding transcriptional ArsR family regulator
VLEDLGLARPLRRLVDGADPAGVFRDLAAAVDDVSSEHPAVGVARWVDEDVRDPMGQATLDGGAAPDLSAAEGDLPVGGDLAELVDSTVEAVRRPGAARREQIAAATTALQGGPEGCRRLAAWANDGYSHPDAHHLLTGVSSDVPGARRVDFDGWAYDPDATDGTVVDSVPTTTRATAVVDRNGHGARLHTPPSRTAGNGEDAPLVGLNATGRRDLWTTALGEGVTLADIHDTPAERAEFLETALDLRVIQAADRPRPYEGDPTTKDTDGDIALLQAIAEEYAGIKAPRERGGQAVPIGKPAAVPTKQVREVLEGDERLDGVVAAWENYGNVTGKNDLKEYRPAAIFGSQHYGDHAIERFCALRGREVDTSRDTGRGGDLDYGDDLANEYLWHMREDQTMQAVLRFARDKEHGGATVVARTSALREDLPVVGDAQVVGTWSDTAAAIAREYRRLPGEFTATDVRDAVDVGPRQVRRVLGELAEAGYVELVDSGAGIATTYSQVGQPGADEVSLPEREEAIPSVDEPGRAADNQYYTWNVRVRGGDERHTRTERPTPARSTRAPPPPSLADGVEPPG